ncbi:MAG: phytanoyl-CoA dioxygenase family protein [Bryobacterales bacterium]|nr:phytanoyl-CoA dioxygenase family protein [Bryobacterales bacterium]
MSLSAGYAITPDCLKQDECDALLAALAPLPRTRAGVRHLLSASPAAAALAADARLRQLAASWLGTPDPIPFRATLFEKSSKANWLIHWHQDTALPLATRVDASGWGPWSEKNGVHYAHAPAWALERVIALRVHLDACTADNGPLRVLPGSHRGGVLTDAQVAEHAAQLAPIACHCPRGGVVAMRPLLIHASSKCVTNSPRRVVHIEYAAALDLAPGIRLAVV